MLSTHFNIHYNKSKWYELVVIHLLSEFGARFENEVRCFVTNAVRALSHNAIGLKIPRGRVFYTGNKQSISHTRMITLLDEMEKSDYVDLYIGGVVAWSAGEPTSVEQSVTVLKEKLCLLLGKVDNRVKVRTTDEDVIEITERKTKLKLNTQGVCGVREKRRTVLDFNTALIESRISLKGIELPSQHYKRVFIENLETGGRWYNSSGGVQTMDSLLRKYLRIDGEELVELDYSAMHAGILYEAIDADLPVDFDPYGVDLMEDYFDPNAVEQFKRKQGVSNYKPDRNLVKMMVMIALNAGDKTSAKRAIAQRVGQDRKRVGKDDEKKCQYFGLIEGNPFDEIYGRILEHNQPIADSFFSDCGVKLQNIDSEILECVIIDLLAQGEICLPWHDGLMVKRQHKELVVDSMYKAWYKCLGSVRFCKVEEK